MKRLRKVLAAVALLVFALSSSVWAQQQLQDLRGAQPKVVRSPDVGNDLYVFVLCWRNLEFFDVHIKAFEQAGKILGVKTRVMGPADFDVPAEISAMQSAIALRPAGILIYPPSPALGPVINQAEEAGIPVVTVTGDVPGSKRTTFVGVDQHAVGVLGGEYLAKQLGGSGTVAVLSITTPMFQQREQGYIDTFRRYPGLRIVATGDTQGNFSTGISVAKSILQAHPGLDAFVCVDSVGARSAVTAIREAGLTGKVKVIGMDRNNDTVRDVGRGLVDASVAQKGALTTFYGMMVLYNLRHNPMDITSDNETAGVVSAPAWIDTGVALVTKDNWRLWVR